MIAVVTDSSSQLTATQASDADIHVAPIVVVINGEAFHEGVDLDAEMFYDRVAGLDRVSLSTSQPSPGSFAQLYRRLADEGVDEIVSIHVAETSSGTLNAARLGALEVDVPVHLVDSNMSSYGLGVLALEAARAIANGATSADVLDLVDALVAEMSVVFLLTDPTQTLRGGRMRSSELPDGTAEVLILGGLSGMFDVIGSGRTVDDLIDGMAEFLLVGDHRRHVAVAWAGPNTIAYTEGLETRLGASDKVASVHRYRMGASVAVHTGADTAGGFAWPAAQ